MTPIPPPDEVRRLWPLWEQLQANFLAAATAVPEHSLSVTDRPDANAFAQFCEMAGLVVDVGCGTQRLPTYADPSRCRFVGIDPLPGEQERDFEFLQGLGEYLPFRTGSVDQVVFATSLDHMLVPSRALVEAARVIRPGGAVNIWFGELPVPSTIQRLRTVVGHLLERCGLRRTPPGEPEPDYIAGIEQPEGAVDKFHVAHPTPPTITRWLVAAGLQPSEPERIDYASGCFIRGTKPG
jgi:SAM-dependent methyltransferase